MIDKQILVKAICYWIAAILMLLVLDALGHYYHVLDRAILKSLYQFQSNTLNRLFLAITWLGSSFVLGPLTIILMIFLYKNHSMMQSWFLFISLVGSGLIGRLLKLYFGRSRPDFFGVVGQLPSDLSFPSIHTTQITAFVMALLLLAKSNLSRVWNTLTLLFGVSVICLVALSRSYLQVHYPSDLLGGAILASFWVLGLANLMISTRSV